LNPDEGILHHTRRGEEIQESFAYAVCVYIYIYVYLYIYIYIYMYINIFINVYIYIYIFIYMYIEYIPMFPGCVIFGKLAARPFRKEPRSPCPSPR